MSRRVLVVEDDRALREAMSDTLELAAYDVLLAENAEQALQIIADQALDMVVSDINMPGMDGLELLQHSKRLDRNLPVLLVTAYASIAKSVEAMRAGAVDYLMKPFEPHVLLELLDKHISTPAAQTVADAPVVHDPKSLRLLQMAARVAATDATVFISGESGTGKEVLARYVHTQSTRANNAFIAVNCAAIPENMLEAMLFGYEKGAFTGAYKSTPGKFEQANGGTLLLDEVSEMDLGLQAKLLRVIQEREVERLGGRAPVSLDVRIVATSNRDMREAVAQGTFREDLFYRLNVFPLRWLPLRERAQDIVPIAEHLVRKHAQQLNRAPAVLSDCAREELLARRWPGNIRELDNVVQRALILQPGQALLAADLWSDDDIYGELPPLEAANDVSNTEKSIAVSTPAVEKPLVDSLTHREFELILETLRSFDGNRKRSAEKLGVSARTLRYKLARMREHGIDIDEQLGLQTA